MSVDQYIRPLVYAMARVSTMIGRDCTGNEDESNHRPRSIKRSAQKKLVRFGAQSKACWRSWASVAQAIQPHIEERRRQFELHHPLEIQGV